MVDSDKTAAQGLFRSSTELPTAEFLPAPRSVRQQLREAEEAIQEKRFSDAALRLGDLIRRSAGDDSDSPSQDYFLEGDAPEPASIMDRLEQGDSSFPTDSVVRRARAIVAGLPKAGWEMIQLRYEPLAKKMLAEAAPTQDWQKVEQVRREFFFTHSGIEASVLLAQRSWHLGHSLKTSILLDEVVKTNHALNHLQDLNIADHVITLHAMACRMSERELVEPVRLPKAYQNQLKNGPSDTETWVRWIDDLVQKSVSGNTRDLGGQARSTKDYKFFGGTSDRNGPSQGQLPISNPRWMVESTGSPRQERMIEAETREMKSAGILPPPSWTPLRVGNQLLMRTTQRLLGVDYRTGKRVWQYPWFSPTEEIQTREEEDFARLEREEDPAEILSQRVWNDVPYGQISSDGERVYMIDNLGKVEMQRITPFQIRQMRNLQSGNNTLVALDLATEGKLLWQIGGDDTEDSSGKEIFFLGPPLPIDGELYVIAEIAGEIVLLCLRDEDGSEVWRQVLVSVSSGGITSDPVRRVAGAMPCYHQGMLICPTGAGVTIALDLADRVLRWGVRHPRNQEFSRNVFRPSTDFSMNQLTQRWSGSVRLRITPHWY